METVPGFADAECLWTQRLGNLRNTVRQELIARQLAEHVSPYSTSGVAREPRRSGWPDRDVAWSASTARPNC